MPGARPRNFRPGDLAEGLGLELLRPFAFVAPIPRSEDAGVDGIATLFRRSGRKLVAEDSFLVQVKAASQRTLKFEGESLEWLRSLRLPYYVLSVDLATTTMELRSIVRASQHPNYRDRESVTMNLDETPFKLADEEMHVWLREPILRWTPADAADAAFQQTAYDVMKAWVSFEMENIGLRSLGIARQITWETNCVPVLDGGQSIMLRPGELHDVLEAIRPNIHWLMVSAVSFSSDDQADDLALGSLLIANYMRRHGVDPDPEGVVTSMLAHHRGKARRNEAEDLVSARSSLQQSVFDALQRFVAE